MKRFFILPFLAFLLSSCASDKCESSIHIIPHPDFIEAKKSCFDLSEATFCADNDFDSLSLAAVNSFVSRFDLVSGMEHDIHYGDNADADVNFVFNENLKKEEYRIFVKRGGVRIEASGLNGVCYAVQTLMQLMPVEIFSDKVCTDISWKIPFVHIEDSPRFAYRGFMLDSARHFFEVSEVKRVIDILSMYKLNTLHWHLTDDQGWRVEIKKYPELVKKGSVRKHTVIRKEWGNYDGIPYGGWYSQEELKDVVAYAQSRGISIIPEIDLPGHMLAALTSYPELGCTGGPYEVWGRWGVSEDVLCVGNEKTYEFIQNVLDEIMEIFPAEYIHIGGDECPKKRWHSCPLCQLKIKELGIEADSLHTAEQYLQSYVMNRVAEYLGSKGRKVIGWDEILEGAIDENVTIMSWRGSEGGIQAAAKNMKAIMTPSTHFYFDYYQSRNLDNEPFGWGGYIPVERVYEYEPFTTEMTEKEKSMIWGVQANLWTEYVLSNEHLEYMILPRIAALSEVQWCGEGKRDAEKFQKSLCRHAAIYRQVPYNFCTAFFEVSGTCVPAEDHKSILLHLNTFDGAPVYYTTDGSEVSSESQLYTGPVVVDGNCTVSANVFREGFECRPWKKTFTASKALGHEIVSMTEPSQWHVNGAPQSLTNGLVGGKSFVFKEWSGWRDSRVEFVLDMQDEIYSGVAIGILTELDIDVFPPESITVCTSDDNEHYTERGSLKIKAAREGDSDARDVFEISFDECNDRYLKIEIQQMPTIPLWHHSAGAKPFVFVDEISVY